MKDRFKSIKIWIKYDHGKSFLGLLLGLVAFLVLNKTMNILWLSIIVGLIIGISCMIFLQIKNIEKYADEYDDFHKKVRSIDPKELEGFSENVDKILELDEELVAFFNKYSSGKTPDYFEKELNKQWEIHGDEFVKRADDILSKMTNQEIMYTLLGTEMIKMITDVFKHFKPYKIDVDYLKEHPDKAKEYYYENLMQQDAIAKTAMNEHYYNIIMDLNYFEEIEKFVLSQMSNEELMELADSSKDWREKLYYYGFLKK